MRSFDYQPKHDTILPVWIYVLKTQAPWFFGKHLGLFSSPASPHWLGVGTLPQWWTKQSQSLSSWSKGTSRNKFSSHGRIGKIPFKRMFGRIPKRALKSNPCKLIFGINLHKSTPANGEYLELRPGLVSTDLCRWNLCKLIYIYIRNTSAKPEILVFKIFLVQLARNLIIYHCKMLGSWFFFREMEAIFPLIIQSYHHSTSHKTSTSTHQTSTSTHQTSTSTH